MSLSTSFNDEHILATLQEERKVTARYSSPVPIIEQENTLASAILIDKETEKISSQTIYETSKILKITSNSPQSHKPPSK